MLAQYGRQDSNLRDLAPKASAWPLRYARLCRSDGTRTHAQLLMREPLSPLSYGAMVCRVGFEPTRFLPGLRPGPFGLSGICTWCDRRDSNAHSFERRSRRRGSASFPPRSRGRRSRTRTDKALRPARSERAGSTISPLAGLVRSPRVELGRPKAPRFERGTSASFITIAWLSALESNQAQRG